MYRDAVDPPEPTDDAIATLRERDGTFIARGLAESGPLALRVLTTSDEPIDEALLEGRLSAARRLRADTLPPDTSAFRLIHGEGDRLPGLVCDVYGEHAVVRTYGAAGDYILRALLSGTALRRTLDALGVKSLLRKKSTRHDGARDEESEARVIYGTPPSEAFEVLECGRRMLVDVLHGQKTGLFLDQRPARTRTATVIARSGSKSMLNLYGYTGGFSLAAAAGGATSITTVDVAAPALALATRSMRMFAATHPNLTHRELAQDVPTFVVAAHTRGERYDFIVADPPNFAPSEASLPAATRSYTLLHSSCLRLLSPNGFYLAASCSSHLDRAGFEDTIRQGAARLDRVVQIVDRWGAGSDHPTLLAFPEGNYLKACLVRVLR